MYTYRYIHKPVIDFISIWHDTTSWWLQNKHLNTLATPAFFFFATFFAAFFLLPMFLHYIYIKKVVMQLLSLLNQAQWSSQCILDDLKLFCYHFAKKKLSFKFIGSFWCLRTLHATCLFSATFQLSQTLLK
jgi:hypothetical protein